MADNTLTGLIPDLYQALDTVSRELAGFIPAVLRNASAERAAVGEKIAWPVVPAGTVGNITAAATGPDPAAKTYEAPYATISKARSVPFFLTGEEEKGLGNAGIDQVIIRNNFSDAIRLLVNEIEVDLAAASYKGASRAYGTAGTAPFGTAEDLSDFANIVKILNDNGAPNNDRHLVMNSAAALNLRGKHKELLNVAAAGGDLLLREGSLGKIHGLALGESAGLVLHTKGTGASYVFDGAHAIGVHDIVLKTGTGTILAGDIITQVDDTVNKYVVNTGIDAPGTLVIGKPGLVSVDGDTGDAVTVGANYTPNVAFHRNAIFLVARAPAAPTQGDAAIDSFTIQDPVTGLAFEVRMYAQYRRIAFEVGIAWGVKAVKSEHIAILLG